MKAGILILCCLINLALLQTTASACSCANLSDEARRARGDLVFIGTAVRVRESTTLFSVEEVLKGQVSRELLIDTPSGTCQIKFAQGATYLVSVRLNSGERYTDICYGNKLVRSVEENVALSPAAQGRPTRYIIVPAVVIIIAIVGGWFLLSRHRAA